jgi:hypothetical protein
MLTKDDTKKKKPNPNSILDVKKAKRTETEG